MLRATPGAIVSSKVCHHYMPFLGVMLLVCLFDGIRKATWLSATQKKKEYLDALRLPGETLEVDDSVFNTIERLVYHLYGMQTGHGINQLKIIKI